MGGEPDGASCHAGDVGFFLPIKERMAERSGVNYANKAESRFADQYTAALIAFGSGDTSAWAPYNASADISMAWNLDGGVQTKGYHKSHCDMFESFGFAQNPWGSGPLPTADSALTIIV